MHAGTDQYLSEFAKRYSGQGLVGGQVRGEAGDHNKVFTLEGSQQAEAGNNA